MLPKKLHIEQIERFHKILLDLDEKIELEPNDDKKGELCLKYFKLTQLWSKIDNFIEFTVKHELNILENDDRKF